MHLVQVYMILTCSLSGGGGHRPPLLKRIRGRAGRGKGGQLRRHQRPLRAERRLLDGRRRRRQANQRLASQRLLLRPLRPPESGGGWWRRRQGPTGRRTGLLLGRRRRRRHPLSCHDERFVLGCRRDNFVAARALLVVNPLFRLLRRSHGLCFRGWKAGRRLLLLLLQNN